MMKFSTLLLLASILTLIKPNYAQHSHDGHTRCGTMQHLEWQIQQDPGIEARMEQVEKLMQEWGENNQNTKSTDEIFITIPVVVHVIYATSQQNIPDAQVISQIDVLNDDFQRLNSDTLQTPGAFLGVAGDLEIEFCLASVDPEGNPTNGISRTQTTVSSFSFDNAMKFASQGGADAWPMTEYLNIWVCNLGGGLLGYAQFPNGGSALTDGVVIAYQNFGYNSPGGYPYNKGRTATHEVGHWLNLYHIWGDDGGSCGGSDLVADTPNQGNNYWSCPSFPQNSCSSDDMFMNYMDYTDDACMNIFTNGQKTRAQNAINTFRSSLFVSQACVSDLPTAGFIANHTNIPLDCGVDFTDNSLGEPIAWDWVFEGGTPSTSTEQNPQNISYDAVGSYMVSLTVTNSAGSNSTEVDDYIEVGDFYPEVDFEADKVTFCSNSVVTLMDKTTACPGEWVWSFVPATVTFVNGTDANSQNPELTFDEEGVYSVTLEATNSVGGSTLTKGDYLYSGGLLLPFSEDFENGEESLSAWTIENPDGSTTWELTETEGNEPGTQSMSLYFHDEFSVYERDQLISPVLNLSFINHAALSFKHSYAQYSANLSDSLIVYVSTDCSNTWTRIFYVAEDGSGNFATAEPSSVEFFPESENDWCGTGSNPDCFTIDITQWTGSPDVQFMFETYDLYGNKLYIDDIEVSVFVRTNELSQNDVQISMFPNPAKETLTIDIRNVKGFVDVQILDIQGKVLITERISENNSMITTSLNTSNLGAGVYFVRFNNPGFSKTEKLVIEL